MTAHLHASAYGERKSGSGVDSDQASGRARAFLNLGREYDVQARSNFASEAFLFGVLIIGALVWPGVQSVRALPF